MSTILSTHKHNEKFEFNTKAKNKDKFTVKHSAKEVEYDIKTFIVKNVDEISASLEHLFETKTHDQMQNILTQ